MNKIYVTISLIILTILLTACSTNNYDCETVCKEEIQKDKIRACNSNDKYFGLLHCDDFVDQEYMNIHLQTCIDMCSKGFDVRTKNET